LIFAGVPICLFLMVAGYVIYQRQVNMMLRSEAYGAPIFSLINYSIVGGFDYNRNSLGSEHFLDCPTDENWDPVVEPAVGCKFVSGSVSEGCGFWTFGITCTQIYLPRDYWSNNVLRERLVFVLENTCLMVWDEETASQAIPDFRFDNLPLPIKNYRQRLGCSSAVDTPDYEFVLSVGRLDWSEVHQAGSYDQLDRLLNEDVTEVYSIYNGSNRLTRQ